MSRLKNGRLRAVGRYDSRFNDLLGIRLPCSEIFQSDGLTVHIERKHPDVLAFLPRLPEILAHPDYVGRNPTVPDSIELVKRLGQNVLAAVKLDPDGQYLYVSSLYNLKESKLQRRVNSGRLKAFGAEVDIKPKRWYTEKAR